MFKGLWAAGSAGTVLLAAFSSSSSYQLQNYGVGSGGTNGASSLNYSLNAASGQVSGSGSGSTTVGRTGSIQTQQANVPLAPTVSNGSSTYYNKLQVVINKPAADAADYVYAIAISTNNFATTNYLQVDGTSAGTPAYQSYAAWGGTNGSFATGLSANTAYQFAVSAKQGTFTASRLGPSGTATTANPSLTFSLTPNTVTLGNLLAGTVVNGTSDISFTFATNGASGGSVYVAGANSGLKSTAANNTIAAVSTNLTSASEGFGIRGLATGQTSGGPLTIASPFNGPGTNVGAQTANFQQLFTTSGATVSGTGSARLSGKAAATTPAGNDYTETLTFIASASF
jgi:hypothetical protein